MLFFLFFSEKLKFLFSKKHFLKKRWKKYLLIIIKKKTSHEIWFKQLSQLVNLDVKKIQWHIYIFIYYNFKFVTAKKKLLKQLITGTLPNFYKKKLQKNNKCKTIKKNGGGIGKYKNSTGKRDEMQGKSKNESSLR